jgi:predicted glycoside hydrolase/deacetylase ChbG (UPF0249 family)
VSIVAGLLSHASAFVQKYLRFHLDSHTFPALFPRLQLLEAEFARKFSIVSKRDNLFPEVASTYKLQISSVPSLILRPSPFFYNLNLTSFKTESHYQRNLPYNKPRVLKMHHLFRILAFLALGALSILAAPIEGNLDARDASPVASAAEKRQVKPSLDLP